MVKLRINPAIDPVAVARTYAEHRFVQVHNIFEPAVADYVAQPNAPAMGLGTHYAYPMILAALENWNPDHPIHDLTEFINSPEMIDFARTIIACPGITKIARANSRLKPARLPFAPSV